MNDLISRQEVKEILRTEWVKLFPIELDPYLSLAIEKIENIPSAEPKRSKWRHYEGVLTCIECGAEFYDDIMEYTGDEVPHFCPDCGANMEADE